MVAAEKQLLETRGHTVVQFFRYNRDIESFPRYKKAVLGLTTLWSHGSYREVRAVLARERPDVAHFHNILPLVSPAAYYACRRAGVPVVQTLHNFRLICPSATLFRNGVPCERCPERGLFHAVLNGCYRDARLPTVAVSAMLALHRGCRTWQDKIDAYIALTGFMRDKLVRAGLPREKVFVKPNFTPDRAGPSPDRTFTPPERRALFFGRLSGEKGLTTLLQAWTGIPEVPLDIAGDGPLRETLGRYVREEGLSRVSFTGYQSGDRLERLIREALIVILPSECYEGFPVSLIRAFCAGRPVIASRRGAMAEIVRDGRTGLLFTPGDPEDLRAKVAWAIGHGDLMAAMGKNARREYTLNYTPDINYKQLMQIYGTAAHEKKS